MAKNKVNSMIRTGGQALPNPEFIGLDKKMKPLMEKLREMEHAVREAEIQRELNEIQRNREFAYALLRWLRDPTSRARVPAGVREV